MKKCTRKCPVLGHPQPSITGQITPPQPQPQGQQAQQAQPQALAGVWGAQVGLNCMEAWNGSSRKTCSPVSLLRHNLVIAPILKKWGRRCRRATGCPLQSRSKHYLSPHPMTQSSPFDAPQATKLKSQHPPPPNPLTRKSDATPNPSPSHPPKPTTVHTPPPVPANPMRHPQVCSFITTDPIDALSATWAKPTSGDANFGVELQTDFLNASTRRARSTERQSNCTVCTAWIRELDFWSCLVSIAMIRGGADGDRYLPALMR